MKRNMIIFLVILLFLFAALWFVVDYQNKKQSAGNPYGKDTLHPATIEQLDNEFYQNQILPEELEEKINNNEPVTVYFYDPTCSFCKQLTPEIVPLAEDMGVDLKKMNLLEFNELRQTYNITGTPTVVHFDEGKKVAEEGGADGDYESFFKEYVLAE